LVQDTFDSIFMKTIKMFIKKAKFFKHYFSSYLIIIPIAML
jgi:hypothetical protein